VAVSDPTGTIARPLPPIQKVESSKGRAVLDRVIAEHVPEMIVVGEPRHLSGARGEQAHAAAAFAAALRARVEVPVELVDERLTTVEAGRRASESGSSTSVDSLAACVLLEAFLARR
jgi:putative holliday junction resolvase